MGFNGRVVYSLAPLVGSLPPSHPVFPASPNDALSQQTAVENQLFGIGPETGRIYIKQPLDFETMTAFALTVTASDLGPDSLSSHASIIVHVEDVNDNRPTITVTSLFQQPNIAGGSSNDPGVIASHRRDETSVRPEVAEDAAIGTFVAHLSVTDVDSGRNGNVRCSLAERDVAEGLAASGHGVATVAGSSSPLSDLTAGSGGGDRPAAFDLVRLYGGTEYKLVTAARLDRETRSQYRLTISCCDDGWPLPATSSVHLTVVVTDRNDCAPTFDSATYAAAIYENVEAGRTIVRVRATDCDDAGPNSRVSYRLDPLTPLSADVGRYVQVDKESGLVTLRESLDRERYEQLLFDIVAEDAGSPPLTGRATVRLVVLDRDDQGPVFETDEYRFEVVENHPIGTVVGVVRAIDGDLPPFDRITYEIVSDAYIDAIGLRGSNSSTTESLRLPFSIDADSGKLTTLEVLDREVASMYRFQVKARSDDSIGVIGDDEAVSSSSELRRPVALVATASVIVNVGDVNDNRPKFTFPDRLSTSSVLKTRGERNGGSSMPAAATAVIQLTGTPMAGQIVAKLHAFDPDSQANARPHFGLAAISAESATSSAVNVGNQHHRLQDFDVDPFTGLITVGPGIQRPLSLSASPFGDDKVIRRTLEVTVSDAAEPEVVSDRAILEIVLQTDNAVESEDTSKSRQDAIGSGDGSGIVSAIHDVTLVGHGVGLLASERLVLVLSCLLCVVLLAVAASVIALCAVRSSVTPLEGAAIDSASRQSGSMTVALAARCRSLSTCVVNDADKRFVNGFQTTAAHGFHLRGATADPADV